MLLDSERYDGVIAYGKEAISKLDENRLEEGFSIAEQGWEAFPESGTKWNQGYMEAKYEFEAGNLDKAFEIWQNLVKQKGVGYRYFEYDDPKYIKFYKSRK